MIDDHDDKERIKQIPWKIEIQESKNQNSTLYDRIHN